MTTILSLTSSTMLNPDKKTGNPSKDKIDKLVGKRICKSFGSRKFWGSVIGLYHAGNARFYKISFDDGDVDILSEVEVQQDIQQALTLTEETISAKVRQNPTTKEATEMSYRDLVRNKNNHKRKRTESINPLTSEQKDYDPTSVWKIQLWGDRLYARILVHEGHVYIKSFVPMANGEPGEMVQTGKVELGDVVVAINGKKTVGALLTNKDVSDMIRAASRPIVLSLLRPSMYNGKLSVNELMKIDDEVNAVTQGESTSSAQTSSPSEGTSTSQIMPKKTLPTVDATISTSSVAQPSLQNQPKIDVVMASSTNDAQPIPQNQRIVTSPSNDQPVQQYNPQQILLQHQLERQMQARINQVECQQAPQTFYPSPNVNYAYLQPTLSQRIMYASFHSQQLKQREQSKTQQEQQACQKEMGQRDAQQAREKLQKQEQLVRQKQMELMKQREEQLAHEKILKQRQEQMARNKQLEQQSVEKIVQQLKERQQLAYDKLKKQHKQKQASELRLVLQQQLHKRILDQQQQLQQQQLRNMQKQAHVVDAVQVGQSYTINRYDVPTPSPPGSTVQPTSLSSYVRDQQKNSRDTSSDPQTSFLSTTSKTQTSFLRPNNTSENTFLSSIPCIPLVNSFTSSQSKSTLPSYLKKYNPGDVIEVHITRNRLQITLTTLGKNVSLSSFVQGELGETGEIEASGKVLIGDVLLGAGIYEIRPYTPPINVVELISGMTRPFPIYFRRASWKMMENI